MEILNLEIEQDCDAYNNMGAAESAALDAIQRRVGQFEEIPTCNGMKRVAVRCNTLGIFKPSRFDDLNGVVATALETKLKALWKTKYLDRGRIRPLEIKLIVPYPLGSGYSFRLIALFRADSIEFIHPFKGHLE